MAEKERPHDPLPRVLGGRTWQPPNQIPPRVNQAQPQPNRIRLLEPLFHGTIEESRKLDCPTWHGNGI